MSFRQPINIFIVYTKQIQIKRVKRSQIVVELRTFLISKQNSHSTKNYNSMDSWKKRRYFSSNIGLMII